MVEDVLNLLSNLSACREFHLVSCELPPVRSDFKSHDSNRKGQKLFESLIRLYYSRPDNYYIINSSGVQKCNVIFIISSAAAECNVIF